MPKTEVVFFADETGEAPLAVWLNALPGKVLDKCSVRMERLEQDGYEMRRPESDYLRDGVYELRIRHMNVNHRILYFFHKTMAVLFDWLTKQDVVPPKDIDRAVLAKWQFAADPDGHIFEDRGNEE